MALIKQRDKEGEVVLAQKIQVKYRSKNISVTLKERRQLTKFRKSIGICSADVFKPQVTASLE